MVTDPTVCDVVWTCALWYYRDHTLTYDLYDDERDAAGQAQWMRAHCEGVPVGVQFADGRTILAENWPELAADEERARLAEAKRKAERATAPPPPPPRFRHDPFGSGDMVTVDADDPEWVGAE